MTKTTVTIIIKDIDLDRKTFDISLVSDPPAEFDTSVEYPDDSPAMKISKRIIAASMNYAMNKTIP